MAYLVIPLLVATFGVVQFSVGWYFAIYARSHENDRRIVDAEACWEAPT